MTGPAAGSIESKVSVFISILNGAVALLGNPALGLTGAGKIVALVAYAGSLVRDIAVGADKLKAVDDQIKAIVAAKRPPSAAEWAEVDATLADYDARFAAL